MHMSCLPAAVLPDTSPALPCKSPPASCTASPAGPWSVAPPPTVALFWINVAPLPGWDRQYYYIPSNLKLGRTGMSQNRDAIHTVLETFSHDQGAN